MVSIAYTEEALQNLDEIADYIAQYSLASAKKMIQEIEQNINDVLSEFPHSGEFHDKVNGIRKRNYKGYTTFYRVMGEEIYILHVVSLRKPLEARGIDFS